MKDKIEILPCLVNRGYFKQWHDSIEADPGPAPFEVGEIVQVTNPGHEFYGDKGMVLMCGGTRARVQIAGWPISIATEHLRVTK